MSPEEQVNRILQQHSAVLKRCKKHNVWQFPGGKTFVMARTPSDRKGFENVLSDLRNVLGINDPKRGQPGERRPKRRPQVPQTPPVLRMAHQDPAQQDAMKIAGLMRATLPERISAMVNEMRRASA